MTDAWRRFGRLPAAPVVASYFALAILAAVTLGDTAAWVGVGLTGVLILYCFARRRGGRDVFFAAALPGAAATLGHDLADTPRWLAAALVPIALLLARSADREAAP